VKIYTGAGLGDFYYQLVRDITEYGRRIKTRHGDCIELPFPVVFEYEKPGHCWMRIQERKFNPFFALAEVVWMLSGNGNVEWICHFNENMRQFSDKGKPDFHGSYGKRIRRWHSGDGEVDQINCVFNRLMKDHFSRQGVISLWDPNDDNLIESNDYPCNNLVYFTLRCGVLDQSVVIRSNDVIWGAPYNAVQFTHLHALMAGMLGAKMGRFTYFVENLHYYLDLYKPTLAHVLEQAYDGREIVSECAPSFETVNMKEFSDLQLTVNDILNANKHERFDFLDEGVGYWGHTIPRIILIYELFKKKGDGYVELKYIDGLINSLGQPFVDLIRTFLSKEAK
jgi:thymidylate synthase